MKSLNLKSITVLFIALVLTSGASVSFAQDAPKAPAERSGGAKNDAEFKSDYQAKMAKFDERYAQLKKKEASATDPQMKADIANILSKMDAVKADMSRYEANSSKMSEQEKEQARSSIKTQMNDIKQMHDSAMQKYGKGGKGGGNGKGGDVKHDEQGNVKQGDQKEMQKQKAQEEMKGEKRNKKEGEPK